jgi:hypothetical protein
VSKFENTERDVIKRVEVGNRKKQVTNISLKCFERIERKKKMGMGIEKLYP